MIIYDSQGIPINIRPDAPGFPNFSEVAQEHGLRVEQKTQNFGYKKASWKEVYRGDLLISIESDD